MGSLFGGAKQKAPPPPAPPPTPDTRAEDLERVAKEQRMRSSAAGRASTMLTSGDGVTDEALTAKKKLLGA
jgi:hypothetical protein